MNKERKVIADNTIITIDRIVRASELDTFTQDFCGDVIITKKLIIDKEINIACNLYVIGGIARKNPISQYDININGDFYCYGEIHCQNINVSGSFYSQKIVYSKDIKVGENLICNELIDAYGCDVIVAGDLECHGITAEKVEYLGQISLKGPISVSGEIKSYY